MKSTGEGRRSTDIIFPRPMQPKVINLMPYNSPHMFGILIAYRLKSPHDPNTASVLVKKLYGQNTSSHGGRYRYRRKGLLDEIPSRRLIRGVIIVKEGDQENIIEFLREFQAEIHIRKVVLTQEDLAALGIE